MAIKKDKYDDLEQCMHHLGIRETDLIEKYIIGSGKGGQKINKTASCVYLKHLPTSIEIKCQRERSRELNRYYARRLLCEKITERLNEEKSERQKEIAKIRKQKQRRSRRVKEKILVNKRQQSEKKENRKKPSINFEF